PPPPTSPSFPYTTLFRSLAASRPGSFHLRETASERASSCLAGTEDHVAAILEQLRLGEILLHDPPRGIGLLRHQIELPAGTQERDRKSTRLNSSHQIISY